MSQSRTAGANIEGAKKLALTVLDTVDKIGDLPDEIESLNLPEIYMKAFSSFEHCFRENKRDMNFIHALVDKWRS